MDFLPSGQISKSEAFQRALSLLLPQFLATLNLISPIWLVITEQAGKFFE